MSRSNYDDYCGGRDLILWRGAVAAAVKGARGQQLLRELAAALDAMPEKELIAEDLASPEGVCALGCLGRAKGIDMSRLDPDDPERIGRVFGIATALAQEIAYVNDEWGHHAEPEERWRIVRRWVGEQLPNP